MIENQEAKVVPSSQIQVIPPSVDSAALIQLALESTRQGTGLAGNLVNRVIDGALETDIEIYRKRLIHSNTKILIALHEFNYIIRRIQHYQNQGVVDYQLADITIQHLRRSYEKTLESSEPERFPGFVVFLGVLFSISLVVVNWKSRGFEIPGLPKASNNTSQVTLPLPLPECNKSSNLSNQLWYPVLINQTDSETLNHIKNKYCSASFITTEDVNSSKKVIQVAVFPDRARAEKLKAALESDTKIKNGEIGIPFRTVPQNSK